MIKKANWFLFLTGSAMLALLLFGGVALALTAIQCVENGQCQGTAESDLLKGTDGYNQMYADEGDDVLMGFGSPDLLKGEGGNDRLFGGAVGDSLEGGPGDDTLVGGGGGDHYDLYGGWENDILIDAEISDSEVGTGNLLWVNHSVTEDLLIDLAADSGPEVRNAGGTNTLDWEGDVVDQVIDLSAGDDRIRGNGHANLLAGFDGDNTVRARGGDDVIDVGDGSGGDIVNCGEGEDTVIRDLPATGEPGDTISTNCEIQQDPAIITLEGGATLTGR